MTFRIIAISFLICISAAIASAEYPDYFEITNKYGQQFEPGDKGYKQFRRGEEFWRIRTYPDGKFPTTAQIIDINNSLIQINRKYKDQPMANDWEELGPNSFAPPKIPEYHAYGRVNCVATHPFEPNSIWAGAATGGLWKSTDLGRNWRPLDLGGYMNVGISDIAIAPTDPGLIYIATGDRDGAHMWRGYSMGLLRSADGGASWENITDEFEPDENFLISRILLDPDDPLSAVLATNRGLWMIDSDGTIRKSFITKGWRDLEMHPADKNIIYASGVDAENRGYIYRSENFGKSWSPIFESDTTQRIEMAVSAQAPDHLWAIASDPQFSTYKYLIHSRDRGQTWENIAIADTFFFKTEIIVAQAFYNLELAVDPLDTNRIFAAGVLAGASSDAGRNWTIPELSHVDHHCLHIAHDGHIISGNDGGVYRMPITGNEWQIRSGGLNITQFYKIGGSPLDGGVIFAGSQDNCSFRRRDDEWRHVGTGDGMECIVDYSNPERVFMSYQNGAIFASLNGGDDISYILNDFPSGEKRPWLVEYAQHPAEPNTILVGYENIWRTHTAGISQTTNAGDAWERISVFGQKNETITDVEIHCRQPEYIYVSNADKLYKSSDDGESWQIIFDPEKGIAAVESDPTDPERLWAALSGYQPGEKIYYYDKNEWTNISDGLPNVPVNSIAKDSTRSDGLYAGTDAGAYEYDFGESIWKPAGNGLPNVIVRELEINYVSGELRAATFGRGIWRLRLRDCAIPAPGLNTTGEFVFCEDDTIHAEIINPQPGYDYVWSNGARGLSIDLSEPGTYFAIARGEKGCGAASGRIIIRSEKIEYINMALDGNNPICPGKTVRLYVNMRSGYEGPHDADLVWSTGDTNTFVITDQPGEYYVTAWTESGCHKSSSTFELKQYPPLDTPYVARVGDMLIAPPGYNTYQWYWNLQKLPDGKTRTLRIERAGNYILEVTDSNWCSLRTGRIVVDPPVGDIRIMPNPTDDAFFIESNFEDEQELLAEIFDLTGRLIMTRKIAAGQGYFAERISIGRWTAGLYILRISNNNISKIFKIIKL